MRLEEGVGGVVEDDETVQGGGDGQVLNNSEENVERGVGLVYEPEVCGGAGGLDDDKLQDTEADVVDEGGVKGGWGKEV